MTNDPSNGQSEAQGDIPETCTPDGTHHWPGPASTESTPCLCGEKTMSVEYVTRQADDIEGGGE